MVGIVIVSHSATLASGVEELARGMAGEAVRLKAVGGLDMPDHPLGTDAQLILNAIQEVYSPDGVLVLMDLGSALMSAEIALELLEPEEREHVVLCDAPIVEGAIAAAVQARIGSSLAQVQAEAKQALTAKIEHINTSGIPAPEPEATTVVPTTESEFVRLKVRNRLGLHARPAARFVQEAGRFQADVSVTNLTTNAGPVNAKSINAVITLGVQQNHDIQVNASGADAAAVLAAVCLLASQNFGDELEAEAQPTKVTPPIETPVEAEPGALKGLAVSPGIVIGQARRVQAGNTQLVIPSYAVTNPDEEWQVFLAALEKTRAQIEATRNTVAQRADKETAAIFEAHLLFLNDEALQAPVKKAVFEEKKNAAASWNEAVNQMAEQYRTLDTDYLRARAADVLEVGQQVLTILINKEGPTRTTLIAEPGILVAEDITAADTAGLDPKFVLGILTALGSSTSHSAILARTLGIPAVAGLGERLQRITEGMPVILDGNSGQVWLSPDEAVKERYEKLAETAKAEQGQANAVRHEPAVTRDGVRVEVAANIGSEADAVAAVEAGAEAVGLLRTEFLFLDRQTAPDEGEQYNAYRAIAKALAGRPLVIRTLDIGGDKPVAYINQATEANPFLGWRAIRIGLAEPEFFKVQLRAIVRAAAEFPVRVMFPMVATLGEWSAARGLLNEARNEVRGRGQSAPEKIETGIMIEIPAAALLADQFAKQVDFFSIGTNDLTQYTLAAERGNARVAELADAFNPAVLKLIDQTTQAAHANGKWVGVCGELAGDPVAVPLLVGLGIDELSMSSPAIPRAKQIIRTLDKAALQIQAQAALGLETAAQVRQMFS